MTPSATNPAVGPVNGTGGTIMAQADASSNFDVTPVPEPAATAAALVAFAALALLRRKAR